MRHMKLMQIILDIINVSTQFSLSSISPFLGLNQQKLPFLILMCQPSRANRIPKISLMNGSAFCQLRQCLACNIPLDAGTMRRDGGTHPLCDACANHQKMNGIRGGPSGSSTSAGGSAAGSGSGASTGTNNGVRSGGSRGSRVSSSSSSVSQKKTCELRLLQAIFSPTPTNEHLKMCSCQRGILIKIQILQMGCFN